MSFAGWMVLVAALLPYVAVGIAKWRDPSYDNANPRGWYDTLAGWRARALGAQANGFEAFPAFAAAVILAQLAHAPQGRVDLLAGLFIACRAAYIWLYVTDRPSQRSLVWGAGFLCMLLIFGSAL